MIRQHMEYLLESARREAQRAMLPFIRFASWHPASDPLVVGRHTAEICAAFDWALSEYLAGRSSYLDIDVCFRHGKSDLSSRAGPAYLLGRLQAHQPDIMLLAHSAGLAMDFSRDVKAILASDRYQAVFPGVAPERGRDSAESWAISGSRGRCTFTGLGGGYMGKGANVLIVDDWFAGKDEARSEAARKTRWESFTDALSRLAPVHIVMTVSTSWHVDDPRARMRKAEKEDLRFPKFRHLRYPARNPDGSWLFPERFPTSWYEAQYASQGRWAPALLDCSPTVDGGNRFDVSKVKRHPLSEFPQARYVRAWDLASSAKERDKDDPDWTVGELITCTRENGVPHLWVKDVASIRAEAPRRDALIQSTARADGPSVAQLVEAFGGYKDAYTTLKAVLSGISVVRPSHLTGDKSAKLSPLEPIFDAGNVHLPIGAPWADELLRQFREFPDGAHDDYCDPAAIAYHELTTVRSGFL